MEALAQSNDLLQQQQQSQEVQQGQYTSEELAAFTAGMAAVMAAQGQQMPFADELQQLQQPQQQQQHQYMVANQAAMSDWDANSALLATLQQHHQQQQWQQPSGRRSGMAFPTTTQAAAQMRARAALTGEPWLGDMQQGIAPCYPMGLTPAVAGIHSQRQQAGLFQGKGSPFADASSACPAPHGDDVYSAAAAYLGSQRSGSAEHLFGSVSADESWKEIPVGLGNLWQAEDQGTPQSLPNS